MKAITFSTTLNIEQEYYPKPASNYLPEWYKNAKSYVHDKKIPGGHGNTTGTIKKCMPVFDVITSGYIIVSPADVFVSQRDNEPYFEWPNYNLITFHPAEQGANHPKTNNMATPKWNNPWAIKTAPGYSSLFVQPFHRESVFELLPGMVDTDTYTANVNFPFALKNPKFEGLIPAGTPIAQIIPIKREVWKMELGETNSLQVVNKLSTKLFDSYKSLFWNKKEYK